MQAFGASILEDQGVLNAYTKVPKLTAAADKGGSEDSISASERTTERTAERLEPTSHELMELEDIQSVGDQLMGAGVTQESDTATVFPFSLCGAADNEVKVHAKGTARNYSANDKESEARSTILDSLATHATEPPETRLTHPAAILPKRLTTAITSLPHSMRPSQTTLSRLYLFWPNTRTPMLLIPLPPAFRPAFRTSPPLSEERPTLLPALLRLTSLKPIQMFRMSWNVPVRERPHLSLT